MSPREAPSDVVPFAALAQRFAGDPRITLPGSKRGKFGSNRIRVDGKVFAMWVKDALVVKLPEAEVDAAVQAGRGERLTMGRGRTYCRASQARPSCSRRTTS